jgi:FkbM family methyltransferase
VVHAVRAGWYIVSLALFRSVYDSRRSVRLFGLRFSYDSADSLEALLHEHFAENVFFFRSSVATPVILDVGANVGDTVLYFKHLYPRARVYAFEPLPDAFRLLRQNVEQNRLENVHCFQEALANRNGTMEMHYQMGSSYALSGSDKKVLEHLGGGGQDATPVFRNVAVACSNFAERLAALNVEQIDLLKLDVEGVEVPLIENIELWLPRIRTIAMEYHMASTLERNSFDGLVALLHRHGYRLRVFGDPRYSGDDSPSSETFYVYAAR